MLISQATIGDQIFDVRMDIDTTSGKFDTSNGQWAQVNSGTKFIVPVIKGSVITMGEIMGSDGVYTIGGESFAVSTGGSYTATEDGTVEIVAGNPSGSWWRGFTVTYPKAEAPEPEVVNTVIGKFVGENDKSEATAVESEITPNGMSISSIKWTVGDYAGKYEGNISGESKVYFGLVIPDTLDAEVGSVTDEIVTTVE